MSRLRVTLIKLTMDDILKAINATDTVIDNFLDSNKGSEQHTKGIVLKENKAEIKKWVDAQLESKHLAIGMENPRQIHDEIIASFKLKFPTHLKTLIDKYQAQFLPSHMTDEALEKEISELLEIEKNVDQTKLQDKSTMPGHLPKTGGIYNNDEAVLAKAIEMHQEKAKRNLEPQLAAHDFDSTESDERRNLEKNTHINMMSGSKDQKTDSFNKKNSNKLSGNRNVLFVETATIMHYPSEETSNRLGELLEERERRVQLVKSNRNF